MLAASDQSKARICRDMRNEVFSNAYFKYTEDQKKYFMELSDAGDFESAINYLDNTMLPYLKKSNPDWYELQWIHIKVELSTIADYEPQLKTMTDEAISLSAVDVLLRGFRKLLNKNYLRISGDLLYLLQELCKLPQSDKTKAEKHCVFHLQLQILRNREYAKYITSSVKDAFLYLQEKYHCFDENDPREMSMLNMEARKNDFQADWNQYFNVSAPVSKPRTTLDDLRRLMNEMDLRHAEEVHHLFMDNYIDYSDYEFRDEWMMDAYHECFHEYFRSGGDYISQLNNYVIEILKEWQQDAYHKYQKAKKDLLWWIQDPIPEFKPTLEKEIDAAINSVGDTDDDEVMVQALMSFPLRIADIIRAGNYENAAANLFYLFDYMAAFEKRHENWFKSLWSGGEMSKMSCFFDTISELYCHLRQMKEVPDSMKDEMDIHLRIFNRKTYFFGDLWGDSRFEDMLLDGKEQFNNYSLLEECSMWKHWYLPNYGNQASKVWEN